MRPGKEIDLLLAIRAKARAAVLASYPTDTASGDPASFPDGADGVPVVDLKVDIDLTQPGSDLPSSENIRPITVWTGATISRSGADTSDPEELSVSWQAEAGNVCAGTLDVTTGVLTVTYIDISDLAESMTLNSSGADYVQFRFDTTLPGSPLPDVKSDRLSSDYPSGTVNRPSAFNSNGKTATFGNVPKAVLSSYDKEGLNAWVAQAHPQFVVQLTTPRVYQLTPTQVRTLLGENNIWSDTGAVTVEYRADLEKYIEKKIGEGDAGTLSLGAAPSVIRPGMGLEMQPLGMDDTGVDYIDDLEDDAESYPDDLADEYYEPEEDTEEPEEEEDTDDTAE